MVRLRSQSIIVILIPNHYKINHHMFVDVLQSSNDILAFLQVHPNIKTLILRGDMSLELSHILLNPNDGPALSDGEYPDVRGLDNVLWPALEILEIQQISSNVRASRKTLSKNFIRLLNRRPQLRTIVALQGIADKFFDSLEQQFPERFML
jgi:hypothetical protein